MVAWPAGPSLSAVVGWREAVEQLTDPDVEVVDHLRTDTKKTTKLEPALASAGPWGMI